MCNKGTQNIIDISDVHIMTNIGYELVLKNVRHVTGLRLNLILVKMLNDDKFNYKFGVIN